MGRLGQLAWNKGLAHLPGAQCGKWRGDAVGYHGVHHRLRKERGKASDHLCVCGKQAQEWAFDELTGYSTDLSRYTPMCIRCHRAHDGTLANLVPGGSK